MLKFLDSVYFKVVLLAISALTFLGSILLNLILNKNLMRKLSAIQNAMVQGMNFRGIFTTFEASRFFERRGDNHWFALYFKITKRSHEFENYLSFWIYVWFKSIKVVKNNDLLKTFVCFGVVLNRQTGG